MRLCLAAMTSAMLLSCVPAGAGSLVCRVADPTGTPLNIRMEPNGKTVATARNGESIQVFTGEEKTDSRGRVWYFVALRTSSAPDGYAFAQYIRCP